MAQFVHIQHPKVAFISYARLVRYTTDDDFSNTVRATLFIDTLDREELMILNPFIGEQHEWTPFCQVGDKTVWHRDGGLQAKESMEENVDVTELAATSLEDADEVMAQLAYAAMLLLSKYDNMTTFNVEGN